MPHKPTIEISFTPEFKRNLRGLAKKYPHIRSDVQPVIEQFNAGNLSATRFKGQAIHFSKFVFATVMYLAEKAAAIV
jgi:hypothetical protein